MATVNTIELKRQRDLKGKTQKHMADELGRQLNLDKYPSSTYAAKESKGNFTGNEIQVICSFLDIEPEAIMLSQVSKKDKPHEEANLNEMRQMISTFLERNLAVQEALLEHLATLKGTTPEEEDAGVSRKVIENRKKYSKKGNR